ncbi:unnamed protein product, partial [Pocillopora meandrina]
SFQGQFGLKKESDDDDAKSKVGQQASSTAAVGSLDFADNSLSDKSEATPVEKKVDMKDAPLVDQEKSQLHSSGKLKDLEIGSSTDHFTSKKESDDDGNKPKGRRDQYKTE